MDKERNVRLFTALELPEKMRSLLTGLQHDFSGMCWTNASTMHLTLRFIGEVPQPVAVLIRERLRLVHSCPFAIVLQRLGAFVRRPQGILWAGFETSEELLLLRRKVDEAIDTVCEPAPADRYLPHITLGRMRAADPKRLRSFVSAHTEEVRSCLLYVRDFVLFSSVLRPGGPLYTPIERYALKMGCE